MAVYLGLNDCKFEGPLPSELGQLWNMTRMQIQKNALTGTIPHTLGRMEKLDLITMEGNRLSGEVPPEMCELRRENLRQFVVDCPNPRNGLGIICPVPQCCTLCRDSRD
jgi:hypothetical protein